MIYDNSGENRSYGAETNLIYPMKPFTFELGLSHVKSEALDMADPGNAGSTTDLEYEAFPSWTMRAGMMYHLESYDIKFYLNNRVHMDWKDSPTNINLAAKDLSTYWRTDLNVSKRFFQKFELSLNIKNLFDRENFVPSLWGAEYGFEESGISGLLRLSCKW